MLIISVKKRTLLISFLLIAFLGLFFVLPVALANARPHSYTIFIDPGHGGRDGGSAVDGVIEKDINLSISYLLKSYLENSGFTVYMTRYIDEDLSSSTTNFKREDIHKRVKMINESDADIYISIHSNAIPSPRWSGGQTFYNASNKENQQLAFFIQNQLINNTNTTRLIKELSGKYLIDNVEKVGVLVEVGFISNEKERELLVTNSYQDIIAYSIYQGILDYLGS